MMFQAFAEFWHCRCEPSAEVTCFLPRTIGGRPALYGLEISSCAFTSRLFWKYIYITSHTLSAATRASLLLAAGHRELAEP